jgi:hypothetical protein
VVEIDPETGDVRIDRYVVAEDCGVMINPMIVEGQVRGGVAQGIAAALYEQLIYDDEGQLVTSTLMDYLVPTAMEIPPVEILHLETPCEYSETGAKGVGEGGTMGAPAAVASAVADALSHLDVEIDRLPITPDLLRPRSGTHEHAKGTFHERYHPVRITVNGRLHEVDVESRRTLAEVLRHDLGYTGTHLGCEHGICGACTVLVDGLAVRSCLAFGVQADGREIETVEGLESDGSSTLCKRPSRPTTRCSVGSARPGS